MVKHLGGLAFTCKMTFAQWHCFIRQCNATTLITILLSPPRLPCLYSAVSASLHSCLYPMGLSSFFFWCLCHPPLAISLSPVCCWFECLTFDDCVCMMNTWMHACSWWSHGWCIHKYSDFLIELVSVVLLLARPDGWPAIRLCSGLH